MCNALYDLGDSPDFWGKGSSVDVAGGEPFQVFDLNGMMGVHSEIDAYLDGHLNMIHAFNQKEEPPFFLSILLSHHLAAGLALFS